jgi:polyisoprenyl-teichoic acid--peptidoglycan teichoic acid transferase
MRVSPIGVLVVLLLGMVATGGAALFTYSTVRDLVLESPVELPPPPQVGEAQPTPTATRTPQDAQGTPDAAATGEAVSDLAGTDTNTDVNTDINNASGDPSGEQLVSDIPTLDDPTRVTVLLLGIDQRKGETGPFRTDTMIVLSLDPVRQTGVILSIPRDVYMTLPVLNVTDRINNANYRGELAQYPGGGPALAVRAVEDLLGIRIDNYVMVNFEAFYTVINAIGPVEVCPQERIFDDKYPDSETYGFITVEFQPGCQELDAVKLLQYARVRHNSGDDFGRATRQQEVIRAVANKVRSLGGITGLLSQAFAIRDSVFANIKTDMTFEQMLALANAAQEVPQDKIQSAVLTPRNAIDGTGQLGLGKTPAGEDILVPYYEYIHELVSRLFDAGQGVQGADPRAGSATLRILNGAGIEGLAGRTAETLRALGFDVREVGNVEGGLDSYGTSEIRVFNPDKMETARYLAEVLGLQGTSISQGQAGPEGIDITLIVGKDLGDETQ